MPDKLQNEFVESARSYSDTRIMNTINQSINFSKEKVEAAKVVALERSLISEDGISSIGNQLEMTRNAKSMLESGRSVDETFDALIKRGASQEEATEAVHAGSKTANLNKKKVVEEESGKAKWWWIVFIVFIVIRMILRAVRDY